MMEKHGFLAYAFAPDAQTVKTKVAVLGIPEEAGAQRRGCTDAPDALRRASQAFDGPPGPTGRDLGNTIPGTDWSGTLARVLADVAAQGTVPVVLGGGPQVAEKSLALWSDQPVIAASPRLRALRHQSVLWLGLNGPQPAALWDQTMRAGRQHLSARAIDTGEQPAWPAQAVLWLDASVFDTGNAAGASEVNPGGVTPDGLVDVMSQWQGEVRGIVVSGAAPKRDPRALTELVLARIVHQVLFHA